MVGIVNHPNWLTFIRLYMNENNYARVIIYINIRLSFFHFSLQKDVIDYRNILLILFFNKNKCFWMINVYSDPLHTTVKYFKNTKVNICNLLVITSDLYYKMKKCGKKFLYILVEEHYFISLWQERQDTWLVSHMTLCYKAYSSLERPRRVYELEESKQ